MSKQSIVEWFDPSNEGDLEAFYYFIKNRKWPENYVPENVYALPTFELQIGYKIARHHLSEMFDEPEPSIHLISWFDINKEDHKQAYSYFKENGEFPDGFIPENIICTNVDWETWMEHIDKKIVSNFLYKPMTPTCEQEKVPIKDWFNIKSREHRKAFFYFLENKKFPEGFLPDYVIFDKTKISEFTHFVLEKANDTVMGIYDNSISSFDTLGNSIYRAIFGEEEDKEEKKD
jgi:hypothetical protein